MLSKQNKFLKIRPGVELTPLLDRVASKLEPFFAEAKHIAYVTSGKRNPEDQLRIIKDYVKRKNIQDEFIEGAKLGSQVSWKGKIIYSWQLAWSKLLNAGVIINPPLRAEVLLDYINKSGVNRKGAFLNPSVHFSGLALDIGGGANSIGDETAIVKKAIVSKTIPEIVSIVPERENNCLHINVREL